MRLSIIIPTYNEAQNIAGLINFLIKNSDEKLADLIVCDGGSEDDTASIARQARATVVVSPDKGRAAQMNYGAAFAQGDVLYFIHGDTLPPATFIADIFNAIQQGFSLGRYSTRFNSPKAILKINAWFTRFDLFMCMGGDQTLFIRQSLFQACNGFKEDMCIMEEYEFSHRARQRGKYKIMKGKALVSARKYDTNSWLQVQKANATIIRMYKKGAAPQDMLKAYQQLLQYRSNPFSQ